jgi:NADPH:quinone reductase-like Zn-dependent oxidoreductase
MLWLAVGRRKNMISMLTQPRQEDMVFMKELLETGQVTPVIDRRYPLNEIAEAIGYVGEGHARGKVVITM